MEELAEQLRKTLKQLNEERKKNNSWITKNKNKYWFWLSLSYYFIHYDLKFGENK